MKIALRFATGSIAIFERGAWSCADETILACCNAAMRRHSAISQTDLFLRTVRRFAERMRAGMVIEIPPVEKAK